MEELIYFCKICKLTVMSLSTDGIKDQFKKHLKSPMHLEELKKRDIDPETEITDVA